MPTHYKQVLNAYADIEKLINSKNYTLKEISYHINTNYGFGTLFVNKRIEALADRGDIFINKKGLVVPSVFRKEEEKEDAYMAMQEKDDELVDLNDIKNYGKLKPAEEENE